MSEAKRLDPVLGIVAAMIKTYGGRRWLLAVDVLQAATGMVARLQSWGASGCFVVAGRHGTGAEPECDHVLLDMPAMPMMEGLLAAEDALRDLPDDVVAQIDAFDPERRARALVSIFSDDRPVAGRSVFGRRPKRWRDLDDKIVVDALWDACGVERAPSEIVPAREASLWAAARRVDEGAGTVWAPDASQGFHGGAAYTFAVRTQAEGDVAAPKLARRADQARVMPYLEGVPCSIHGIVLPGHVVVLRPAEMLTLRGRRGFVYARAATHWDPAPSVREQLRETARVVGEHLRDTVAYRGAFTIDGVVTAAGFRPTELNPRVGAALGLMHDAVPFGLWNAALIEGVDTVVDPWALERALVAHADEHRRASVMLMFDGTVNETTTYPLVWRDEAWVEPDGEEPADAIASVGPGRLRRVRGASDQARPGSGGCAGGPPGGRVRSVAGPAPGGRHRTPGDGA